MSAFLMPSLGADMEDGVFVEQLKEPGQAINRGDIIAAVETQKGVIEIEAFEDGILGEWLVPIGTTVPVGSPIANIEDGTVTEEPEQIATPQTETLVADKLTPIEEPTFDLQAEQETVQQHPPVISEQIISDDINAEQRQRITPAARRQAAKMGIDPKNFKSDKVITLNDITSASEADIAPMSAMRQAIAAAMTRSKREIPHYYLSDQIDLTAAERFIEEFNVETPPNSRLALGVLYIRALAKGVQSFPEFNGTFKNERFTPSAAAHVGMAINLRGGGLVAPALHDTGSGDLSDLMQRFRDLVKRVREGRFRASELSDPTITLTSLGDRGVRQITGVIFPPQVAIVGIGTPVLRPVVIKGEVAVRSTTTITLAADHRVSDGHRGARFLRAINDNLQKPESL